MAAFLLLLSLSLCSLFPLILALPGNSVSPLSDSSSKLILPIQAVAASASRVYTNTIQGKLSSRDMVQIALLCSVFPAFWYLRNGRKSKAYNDTKSLNGSAHGTIPKQSIDINGELCRNAHSFRKIWNCWARLLIHWICRFRSCRPRTFKKTF